MASDGTSPTSEEGYATMTSPSLRLIISANMKPPSILNINLTSETRSAKKIEKLF